MLEQYDRLLTSTTTEDYIRVLAAALASKLKEKINALDNCAVFNDGKFIEISRPDGQALQNVAFNGHKRKNAMKFQAFTTADGIF